MPRPSPLARGEHGRTRAIAEEHRGAAVLPVGDGGELLGTEDEDVLVRLPEAMSPSATPAANTKPGHAAPMSNAAARWAPMNAWRSQAVRGHAAIGRGGGEDDGVEFLGAHAGARQRHAAGLGGEFGERLVGARHAALADAGALDDPLVGGVERLLRSALVTTRPGRRCRGPGRPRSGVRLIRCGRRWPQTRPRCAGSGRPGPTAPPREWRS